MIAKYLSNMEVQTIPETRAPIASREVRPTPNLGPKESIHVEGAHPEEPARSCRCGFL